MQGGGEKGGGGWNCSLNTLRVGRINYSDVSICQRVPVAQPLHWETATELGGGGQMEGLKAKKKDDVGKQVEAIETSLRRERNKGGRDGRRNHGDGWGGLTGSS